jgi:hypothetical protein
MHVNRPGYQQNPGYQTTAPHAAQDQATTSNGSNGLDSRLKTLIDKAHQQASSETTQRTIDGKEPIRAKAVDAAVMHSYDRPDLSQQAYSKKSGFQGSALAKYVNVYGTYTKQGQQAIDSNYGKWKSDLDDSASGGE